MMEGSTAPASAMGCLSHFDSESTSSFLNLTSPNATLSVRPLSRSVSMITSIETGFLFPPNSQEYHPSCSQTLPYLGSKKFLKWLNNKDEKNSERLVRLSTWQWMPPEVLDSSGGCFLNERMNINSLGIVLWEILTLLFYLKEDKSPPSSSFILHSVRSEVQSSESGVSVLVKQILVMILNWSQVLH